ncbi:substrate-binding domain-containing protein [Immundisolibacter sp.]|jgi:ABC-type phosphate transport system substrate-binding protein|uniref:substrate-binding domain-containing protein n=1 Tax=Immundisolibacter sp. TaxID=1934948 RepID=UPI0019AF9472|nr:substrate-binding domain-containing protein [Immundisolibacter sp.]MBC7161496.1 substrate-binding domain-containing protein [Immundisolibacter sp.]
MPFLKVPGLSRLAMLLALAGNIAAAEVVIVVSPQNPTTTLSTREVSNIFLGKVNRFPNGQPAVPIDQPEDSRPRKEFYRDVSNQQPADIKAYWSRMIFTGRGQPPMVVDGDEQVKKTLAGRPDGIGYIDRAAVDDSVKVLAVQ